MWVEKYRPQNLSEIVNQKDVKGSLSGLMKNQSEMPHLLFSGSAGVGKTTTAICISREILGDVWKDYTLELNASDERGINMVRERVKKFSYVRFAGEDYKKKDIVLKKGELIQPKHLMAFTALGVKEVEVKKKPKIIFFSTGNEIVDYKKQNIPAWKVRNSNNYYFKAFADSMNLEIINGGTIKDNKTNKLKKLLRKFLKSDIDLFVTSGAISAGKYDYIPKLVKNF